MPTLANWSTADPKTARTVADAGTEQSEAIVGLWQVHVPSTTDRGVNGRNQARSGIGYFIGSGRVAPRHRPVDDGRIRGDDDLAHSQRRARARVIQDELRLLLTRWDPIGVADDTEAADEYDCMIGPLYRLLQSGATTVEITGWLAAELDEHFGLAGVPTTDQDFAVDLQRWWAASAEAHEV